MDLHSFFLLCFFFCQYFTTVSNNIGDGSAGIPPTSVEAHASAISACKKQYAIPLHNIYTTAPRGWQKVHRNAGTLNLGTGNAVLFEAVTPHQCCLRVVKAAYKITSACTYFFTVHTYSLRNTSYDAWGHVRKHTLRCTRMRCFF